MSKENYKVVFVDHNGKHCAKLKFFDDIYSAFRPHERGDILLDAEVEKVGDEIIVEGTKRYVAHIVEADLRIDNPPFQAGDLETTEDDFRVVTPNFLCRIFGAKPQKVLKNGSYFFKGGTKKRFVLHGNVIEEHSL